MASLPSRIVPLALVLLVCTCVVVIVHDGYGSAAPQAEPAAPHTSLHAAPPTTSHRRSSPVAHESKTPHVKEAKKQFHVVRSEHAPQLAGASSSSSASSSSASADAEPTPAPLKIVVKDGRNTVTEINKRMGRHEEKIKMMTNKLKNLGKEINNFENIALSKGAVSKLPGPKATHSMLRKALRNVRRSDRQSGRVRRILRKYYRRFKRLSARLPRRAPMGRVAQKRFNKQVQTINKLLDKVPRVVKLAPVSEQWQIRRAHRELRRALRNQIREIRRTVCHKNEVSRWFGSAPFCRGTCPTGWIAVKRSGTGDGRKCWFGTKILCTLDQIVCRYIPSVVEPGQCVNYDVKRWYGTAPLCNGQCPQGWDLIKRDRRGDGCRCLKGAKALCLSKFKPKWCMTNEQTINVFAYSVDMPTPVAVYRKGQAVRAEKIPELATNHDVVIISAAYDNAARRSLRAGLKEYGFKYQTDVVGRKAGVTKNGGVFIASRYPLIAKATEVFDVNPVTLSGDFLGAKGYAYAAVRKGDQTFHVIGTALQGYSSADAAKVRAEQAKVVAGFISKKKLATSEDPVLVGGELGVDANDKTEYAALVKTLGVEDPKIEANTFTYDGLANSLCASKDRTFSDYVFVVKNKAKTEVQKTLTVDKMRYAPGWRQFAWDKPKQYLSDHFGVQFEATFDLKKEESGSSTASSS